MSPFLCPMFVICFIWFVCINAHTRTQHSFSISWDGRKDLSRVQPAVQRVQGSTLYFILLLFVCLWCLVFGFVHYYLNHIHSEWQTKMSPSMSIGHHRIRFTTIHVTGETIRHVRPQRIDRGKKKRPILDKVGVPVGHSFIHPSIHATP